MGLDCRNGDVAEDRSNLAIDFEDPDYDSGYRMTRSRAGDEQRLLLGMHVVGSCRR